MARKFTTQDFIDRAKKVHGDKYDYSKVVYVNKRSKVEIVCETHESFWQIADSHLCSRGCKQCGVKQRAKKATLDTSEFIKKAREVHGDAFDYSKVEYVGSKSKVAIYCPIHGRFLQNPNAHLNGNSCPNCAKNKKMNTASFIEKARNKHGTRYDYSRSEYVSSTRKIEIICRSHGVFYQRPALHLIGQRCPKCVCSKGETKVREFLENRYFLHYHNHRFEGCKYINSLPFDFYLPAYKTLIEYDGEQHFKLAENNFFGGEKSLKERQHRDQIKTDWAAENGYKLIRIPYWDFDNIEEILNRELLGIEPQFVPHQLALF